MKFQLVYPERRVVSAQTVADWYADRCADGEIAEEYLGLGIIRVDEMAKALEDQGIITVAKVLWDD